MKDTIIAIAIVVLLIIAFWWTRGGGGIHSGDDLGREGRAYTAFGEPLPPAGGEPEDREHEIE
jgi:hypothetical protein